MINGCKADIYSLGISILKLLANKCNREQIFELFEKNKENSNF